MPVRKKHWGAGGLAAIMMLAATPSVAEIGKPIEFIRVEGTQRVERETVLTYMVVREGMIDAADLVDGSVKSLFASGLFSDVNIKREEEGLVVNVVENPIINRIAFEGNKAINKDRLTEESTLRPRQIYTRSKVQKDVDRFVEIYRRSGRFAARIEPQIIQLPQNRIDLVYEISEGPVTGIRTIKFVGNRGFSDNRLRQEIATRETRWWRFLSSNANYDPDRLAFDGELLRRFYLSKGYADFRVITSNAELTRDGKEFFLTFNIEEGEIYTFGEGKVESNLKNVDGETLQEAIAHEQGKRYDARSIDKTIDNLVRITGERGFAFADVRPRVNRERETRIINVDYVINEGARVYVERVNINGNDRTRDNVIRRQMRLAEGDAFNQVLLERSERAIRGLDYFENLEVTESPGSTDDQTVVDVNLTEKSTGELNLGLGFSTASNFSLQFGLRERNFLGRGQRLEFSTNLGKYNQAYIVRFTEPYFLGRNLAAGIEVYHTVREYRNSDYQRDRTGIGFSLGFPLSENGRLVLSTSYSFDKVEDYTARVNSGGTVRVINYPGYDSPKHEIGYSYSYDVRDDFIDPTDGWNFNFSQDFATPLGDIYYVRTRASANFYEELAEGWVFHARGSIGHIASYKEGEHILLGDTFYVGGNNFRGFDSGGVGPRLIIGNYSRALGSNKYALGTLEVSVPLGIPKELGIKTALFTDFGWLGDIDTENYSILDRPNIRDDVDFRATAGFSVGWRSPLGPLQLDFATPIKKESYDRDRFFRFSIGTNF